MIPEIFVEQWREKAPWQTLAMIEQDLIISKALIDIYSQPLLQDGLLFRGGTALNKLYVLPAARYSEDIDLVQKTAQPIGQTVNEIRKVLDDWLGEPKRKATERSFKLVYRYQSIDGVPAKLKIEINTTEHFHVQPICKKKHSVESEWFTGSADVAAYSLNELMATKLRALYQRRKGRDLFDLWYVLVNKLIDSQTVVDIFRAYCEFNNQPVSKKLFLENLKRKKASRDFRNDIPLLLNANVEWDFELALTLVENILIEKLSS
jgi:predicted nucleotidyltransferase component of viral defense system